MTGSGCQFRSRIRFRIPAPGSAYRPRSSGPRLTRAAQTSQGGASGGAVLLAVVSVEKSRAALGDEHAGHFVGCQDERHFGGRARRCTRPKGTGTVPRPPRSGSRGTASGSVAWEHWQTGACPWEFSRLPAEPSFSASFVPVRKGFQESTGALTIRLRSSEVEGNRDILSGTGRPEFAAMGRISAIAPRFLSVF